MSDIWDTEAKTVSAFHVSGIHIPLRTQASGAKWCHYYWTNLRLLPKQRQMTLTYCQEVWENPPEVVGPVLSRFEGVWGPTKHQKYLFFFPSYKCNECEGVDANLDPGYILSSLKFCFINCNTGSCFVECCILNHRQPDNEYWRKGNFKLA